MWAYIYARGSKRVKFILSETCEKLTCTLIANVLSENITFVCRLYNIMYCNNSNMHNLI